MTPLLLPLILFNFILLMYMSFYIGFLLIAYLKIVNILESFKI